MMIVHLGHIFDSFFPVNVVLAIAGASLALIFGKHYHKLSASILLLLFVGSVFGKLSFASSSRYYYFALLPMLMLNGYAFYFCRHINFLRRFRAVVLLLVLVLGICTIKVFRPAPHSSCHLNAALAIHEAAKKFRSPVLISSNENDNRIVYYSTIPTLSLNTSWPAEREQFIKILKNELKKYLFLGDGLFFLCKARGDDPPITAADLGVPTEQWLYIGAFPMDRKGNKLLRGYCLAQPDAVNFPSLPESSVGLLENGDFETVASDAETAQIIKSIMLSVPTRFASSPVLQPAGWRLGCRPGVLQNYDQLECGLVSPGLSGTYSLRMAAEKEFTLNVYRAIPIGTYKLIFQAKALKDTLLEVVFIRTETPFGGNRSQGAFAYLHLSAGEEYEYRLPLEITA